MNLFDSIACLEKTLSQINLAFQSIPKFDKDVNFKFYRDAMRERQLDLRNQVMACINDKDVTLKKIKLAEEDNIPTRKITCYSLEEEQQVVKKRRRSHQIERVYKCCMENCDKSYGSEVSLSYHLKMKHSVIYSRRKPTC